MPLLAAILVDEILKLTDKERGDFKGFPIVLTPDGDIDVAGTNDLVADNWSIAAGVFFATIAVPPVPPPAIALGVAAFKSNMFGLLGPPGAPTAAASLAAGFTAFAAVIAANSPPVAVPPPAPLVIPIGPPIQDPTIPATNIASAVLAWTITGLFGVPPAPPSIPWG